MPPAPGTTETCIGARSNTPSSVRRCPVTTAVAGTLRGNDELLSPSGSRTMRVAASSYDDAVTSAISRPSSAYPPLPWPNVPRGPPHAATGPKTETRSGTRSANSGAGLSTPSVWASSSRTVTASSASRIVCR